MKLKLNFTLGEKTINGRYYDPEMLKKQFESLFKKNGKILVGPDSKCINETTGEVPEDKLVGYAESYEILPGGTVLFEVKEMSEATEEYLKNNPDVVKISIFGFGSMDNNKNIREFTLTSLFMTMDG
jgi:hypothetical protein